MRNVIIYIALLLVLFLISLLSLNMVVGLDIDSMMALRASVNYLNVIDSIDEASLTTTPTLTVASTKKCGRLGGAAWEAQGTVLHLRRGAGE